MKLTPIENQNLIQNKKLKELATSHKSRKNSFRFIVKDNDIEIAFLYLEEDKYYEHLNIYMIYVDQKFHKKGFGTRIIKECEKFAVRMNIDTLLVCPAELPGGPSLGKLIMWYQGLGFKKNVEFGESMTKEIR